MVTENTSSSFVLHKSNNINIQLKEPLRGIGSIKDKLIFVNNKLMIERNCISIPINEKNNWTKYGPQNNRPPRSHCYFLSGGPFMEIDMLDNNSVCDIFSKGKGVYGDSDFYPSFTDYNTAHNKYFVHYLDSVDKLKQ
ncbi:hypothetical protein [Paraclostridium dentum]|uniref:hypothetical protein n=1 Tax=Paraclostridium dentum TaxID=2662455 RepID=UPI003F3CD34A